MFGWLRAVRLLVKHLTDLCPELYTPRLQVAQLNAKCKQKFTLEKREKDEDVSTLISLITQIGRKEEEMFHHEEREGHEGRR